MLWNVFFSGVEKKYLKKADFITAVSEDLFFDCNIKNYYTLYNGYEPIKLHDINKYSKQFSICFTGQFYNTHKESINFLMKVISILIDNNIIDKSLFRFVYAGPNPSLLYEIAGQYLLTDIIDDRGYLQPKQIMDLQLSSDLFLVLTINTKKMRGLLCGKFYEGIRAEKLILALVSGDTRNSELYRLNEKYFYGKCIELCRGNEAEKELKDFLSKIYENKLNGDLRSPYSIIKDFSYENISRDLEGICKELTKNVNNCEVMQ